MNQHPEPRSEPETVANRYKKPRIALMGEFSAGKSTLSNLLIGGNALPVRVTATQLPPVWICAGDEDPFYVDVNEVSHSVDLNDLSDIDVEDTQYIRFFRNVDVLGLCDLIDMPGISDPNMSSDVWERMVPYMDAVIWCTHATQAWRQSEAAVWASMPPALKEKSILLLTRMDKIVGERDRARVLARVKKETQGEFAAIFPISLIDALAAGDDREAWEHSGADQFTHCLVDILVSFRNAARRLRSNSGAKQPLSADAGLKLEGVRPVLGSKIIPRRVGAGSNARRPGAAPSGEIASPPQ